MGSENMLAAYKKIKNGGNKANGANVGYSNAPKMEETLTGTVEFLDEQAFGKYIPSIDEGEQKQWSPENEIKTLEKGFTDEQFKNSKLPDYIKESFMINPNNDVSSAKLAMQDVDEKLNERMGGFATSKKIIENIEAKEKKNKSIEAQVRKEIQQQQQQYQPSSSVDYSLIKQIVEDVVSKKIGVLKKNLLTEGVSGSNSPQVSFVRLGDTFTFLDSDDNVYECKMIYKGKRKRK